ncbi:MAG: hypothetical protein E7620_03070 [Ruminococcaceae bacterium]|nr:hypothetical protein [Oscillospiraceae bacterium]
MELSRISALLCICLLSLCLVLSVCTAMVLRSTLHETQQIRETASLLADTSVDLSTEENEDLPAAAPPKGYLLRECNGRIYAYTETGEPIREFDVIVALLPQADRQALTEGILLADWSEVLGVIQDLT